MTSRTSSPSETASPICVSILPAIARCRPCALRGRCPGLFTGYHAAYGDGELSPVTDRARSNSYNYVYEGRLRAPSPGEACPVLALGVSPWSAWVGETFVLSTLYFKLLARFDEGVIFWTLLLMGLLLVWF